MFYSIVSIWRVTTTITGRNALTFITGEMLTTSCFSRNVYQLSCHLFGVNLHIFFTVKTAQLRPVLVLTYTYFTVKTAKLPPLWVLTYTYFYSENSSAATSGVNLHIFYSENRPAATSLGVNYLPPSVVC